MKCRTFELQIADWQASKLSQPIAEQMASHQQSCAQCARIAEQEGGIRRGFEAWREPAKARDIWPRVEAQLDRSAPRPLFRLSNSWALAGAMAAAVPLAIWVTTLHPQPSGTALPPGVPIASIQRPSPPVTTVSDASITTFAVNLLGGGGQSDASIDDPVGGSMEHVWTHVTADIKQRAAD